MMDLVRHGAGYNYINNTLGVTNEVAYTLTVIGVNAGGTAEAVITSSASTAGGLAGTATVAIGHIAFAANNAGNNLPNAINKLEVLRRLDRLTPKQLVNLSLNELENLLPDGWTFNVNGPNGNDFVHIKDVNGNYRIRIDPPDRVTNYRHMHIYDAAGNSLDINNNIVPYDSPAAHIPYSK